MKRNIILFLLAFLLTLGVGAAIYFFLLQGKLPESNAADAPAPASPAVSPSSAGNPSDGAAPEQTDTPSSSSGDAQDQGEPAKDVVSPDADPTSQPSDASSQPSEGANVPVQQTIKPGEKPRSVEHKAALLIEAALKSDDPEAAIRRLVEEGKLSPEAAEVILAWIKDHQAEGVEEVGTYRREDGAQITRYRIKAKDGSEDLLVDVAKRADETVTVEHAGTVSADKTAIAASSDAMTVAEGFVEAVKRGDMLRARSLVTGNEVSDATVAGLCMVFEEGAFQLRQNAPIRNTFQNDAHAGYLVYVISPSSPKPGNFGLELTKEGQGWRINGVALDSLLSSYEDSASAEGGHYFPIVKNPKGGDSLALFFAFNQSDLTPRSLRQLQIVAELLKQSQGKLNISGHTDDVGSEEYNMSLSERRADAVKKALVSFGVQEGQITTHGLGKSQPRSFFTQEDSEQQINYVRGENRRAEIYLDFES